MRAEKKERQEKKKGIVKKQASPRERAGRRGDRGRSGGDTGGRCEQHLARHREGLVNRLEEKRVAKRARARERNAGGGKESKNDC
jgi:hypothetical protein